MNTQASKDVLAFNEHKEKRKDDNVNIYLI